MEISFFLKQHIYFLKKMNRNHFYPSGWLGRAMVLGSFQCRGVLLLWHMVGQRPAACSKCETGGLFFVISSILSSFSNASSLGRRMDILKYCGLGRYNPTVIWTRTSSSIWSGSVRPAIKILQNFIKLTVSIYIKYQSSRNMFDRVW